MDQISEQVIALKQRVGHDLRLDDYIVEVASLVKKNLFSYIYRLGVREPADADDIFSEVLIRFMKSADETEPRGLQWFKTVTRNLVYDRFRRRSSSEQQLDDTNKTGYPHPAMDKKRVIAEKIVRIALTLKPDIQEAVDLCFYQGRTANEASRMLGKPTSTVNYYLKVARREFNADPEIMEYLNEPKR